MKKRHLLYIPITMVALTALFFFLFSISDYNIVLIHGDSMKPTFTNKSTVVIERTEEISLDDIVVFKAPSDWQETYGKTLIKRVVGVPGDKIIATNSNVYINDVLKYSNVSFCEGKSRTMRLAENQYFFVGDNYEHSNDSLRQFCYSGTGYVDISNVKLHGTLKWRLFK